MHWPECLNGSQSDVKFFILQISAMNHNTWVEELFSDTLMRSKFVLVFSGVLAKDCSLTEEQLKFRRECIRIVLYPTEKYFGKILMHSVQLFTIELLINFRNCPCACNL